LALSVIIYSALWETLRKNTAGFKINARRTAILIALCLPLNIGGDVYTVMGGSISDQNSYSLISFYQVAKQDAISILSPLMVDQRAGRNAIVVVGLTAHQNAGRNAATLIGITGYQEAGRDAVSGIGLAGYQRAKNASIIMLGLVGYQKADDSAQSDLGMVLVQKAKEKTRTFSLFSNLY
jgi:hypothetical protein